MYNTYNTVPVYANRHTIKQLEDFIKLLRRSLHRNKLQPEISAAISHCSFFMNMLSGTQAGKIIENITGKLFNTGTPSVYDKAMDTVYNTTHIGGGTLHRLCDGSHTLYGAWKKCMDASPDDSFLSEVSGYFGAVFHDLSSTVGIPLLTITPESIKHLSGFLNQFGVPISWTYDVLHVNLLEVAAASIGVIALLCNKNQNDITRFTEIAASIGIGSIAAANPLGIVISLSALAHAFLKAQAKSIHLNKKFLSGAMTGITKSTLFVTIANIMPGPVLVGILSALIISVLTSGEIDKFIQRSINEQTQNLQLSKKLLSLF